MTPDDKKVHKKLGEILVAKGLVTSQQVDEALVLQKKEGCLIGEALVRLKYVSEEMIAWALTVQYGFPYLPLNGYEVDKDVISVIPLEFAKEHGVIGIDKIGSVLTIATSNPLNFEALGEFEEKTHCKIQVFISTMTEIQEMIQKYYNLNAGSPAKG